MDWKNKLFFGDNLKILREHVADASVDLIYLDPPFNSSATYNVLFKEKSGEESAAQITAFEDTWQWGRDAEAAYREIVERGPRKLADLVQALLAFLGRNDMMAYLVMMAIRLVELHRVLKAVFFEGNPGDIQLPQTVDLKVVETEPGIKGASATNVTKPAKLETGLVVHVPPFISEGEVIRVDTDEGTYLARGN